MIRVFTKLVLASGLLMSTISGLRATPVTMQELGVTPYKIVAVNISGFYVGGGILAGVNKLLVDGAPVDGFCLDPFHWSISGPQPYNTVPLTSAPKDDRLIPGAYMSATEAATIGKLWALAYSQGMTAEEAAGLQIAIWEVVGGSYFQLTSANDYGASLLLSTVNAAGYAGAIANLIGLTGPGQDFVIAGPPSRTSVPDSGQTVTLFAMALVCLAIGSLVKDKSPFFSGRPE
jgi:hypothetical protein